MAYGDKAFGLRDVKLTDISGSTQVDLPSAMVFTFSERVKSGELSGDDKTVSVVTRADAVEWSLENGGISLEAVALMTGRTAASSGTTPNRTLTLTGEATEQFPYFKVYGKSIGDGSDDVHIKLWKVKLTSALEGQFSDGEFWVSKCSGVGIDDGTNGVYDIVQNETAANLPTS
jgi:hypothetical protein